MSTSSARRRRRRIRRIKAFLGYTLIFLLACALVLGGLFLLMKLPGDDVAAPDPTFTPPPVVTQAPTAAPTAEPTAAPTAEPTAVPTPEPTATPEPTPRAAVIRAGGDCMITEGQLGYALAAGDGKSVYDFAPQFELIADELSDADYTILNLETTVGMYKDRPHSGYPLFNAPETVLEVLKDAGVDFLSLANNHMLDRWFDGMKNTVAHVEAAGFDHSGAYISPEARDTARIVEVNGISIGLQSYTEGTNGMEFSADKAAQEYGVPYLAKADFKADVKRLRDAGAEIVILLPHWGEEYVRKPGYGQVQYAKEMAEAGADVILGSHPHVLQKIEWLTSTDESGAEHRTLCAYSLGNFISTQNHHGYTDTGMLLQFEISEQPGGALTIGNVGYVPTYCWKHDNTLQVVPALKYRSQRPDGMSKDAHSRLKTTIEQTRSLIDEAFPEIG